MLGSETIRTESILLRSDYDTPSHSRGRSRAQHVRDREADIKTATNGRLVHLRRLKGEARRAEPTFGLCFRAKASKEANGEARRAEPRLRLL